MNCRSGREMQIPAFDGRQAEHRIPNTEYRTLNNEYRMNTEGEWEDNIDVLIDNQVNVQYIKIKIL
jgi:hypothetical protein